METTRIFKRGSAQYRVSVSKEMLHGYQRVVIDSLGGETKRLWMLIKSGTLGELSEDDFDQLLNDALQLQMLPSGQRALMLQRPGAELVITRGEWHLVMAIAESSGGRPKSWFELDEAEATELAAFFRELDQKLSGKGQPRLPIIPSEELLNFMEGGAFTVVELG